MKDYLVTEHTALKRQPQRAVYDRAAVYRMLDEGLVCHLGIAIDGQPFVIPTAYGRIGDVLFLHGSAASRTLRAVGGGLPVCVTVTLLDGLVLARSAYEHSVNYRSVVVLGVATLVEAPQDKLAALQALTEHMIPGRWDDVRRPNDRELKATAVLALPLVEVSAKVRTGPPNDDDDDLALPVWAGVLPLETQVGVLVDDPRLAPGLEPPPYVTHYTRSTKPPEAGRERRD